MHACGFTYQYTCTIAVSSEYCCSLPLTHVSGIMKSLHWLPIAYRICFKLSVLMHGVHYGTSPSYLMDTITLICHCQDIISFVQQWRLNTTSGQNLETELSLLQDCASGSCASPSFWTLLCLYACVHSLRACMRVCVRARARARVCVYVWSVCDFRLF